MNLHTGTMQYKLPLNQSAELRLLDMGCYEWVQSRYRHSSKDQKTVRVNVDIPERPKNRLSQTTSATNFRIESRLPNDVASLHSQKKQYSKGVSRQTTDPSCQSRTKPGENKSVVVSNSDWGPSVYVYIGIYFRYPANGRLDKKPFCCHRGRGRLVVSIVLWTETPRQRW